MENLVIKLGATGDVVRTSTLLNRLEGNTTWITAEKNLPLIDGVKDELRCFTWEQREAARDRQYDLVINLEDTDDTGEFATSLNAARIYGAYLGESNTLEYTDDSSKWFDLSLISRYGREQADHLKHLNRRTYQDLMFEGLGITFKGDPYLLPRGTDTGLEGDVAISPGAGPVWPMKAWAHFDALQTQLEKAGLTVNVLPMRSTLLEHLGDVQGHRCVVSGDSLPMHLALGSGVKGGSIFNCTSPWEIHEYGLMTKLVSPYLEEHFYKRTFDPKATTAISLDDVFEATLKQLETSRVAI